MASKISPFLDPGPLTTPDTLAIIQLGRDNFEAVYLHDSKGQHDGYAEGAVINTRFGSFPHSTLLNVPWGSQIRASKVDTGSRGRKRKLGEVDSDSTPAREQPDAPKKQAVAASSGFVHVLPPTAEVWTSSLPHRTQVVYTSDYSYILQRIRARPGSRLIEAGAGSGSFTHAAARAVYNGYPEEAGERRGKVFSFEFHEQRFRKMKKDIADHGLKGIVQLTHRDVYGKGFLVDGKSPEAHSVFLDLPAPWEALPHLSRRRPRSDGNGADGTAQGGSESDSSWISPLDPKRSVYLCTFSPCIEQVTRTVSAMRRLGWKDIEMVEIANRKLQIFREKVGLGYGDDRGVNTSPRDVGEALAKLREIEEKNRRQKERATLDGDAMGMDIDNAGVEDADVMIKGATANGATASYYAQKPWMLGRIVSKTEPDIKTHTSYLVFAILPREWTEEDEAEAFAKWPCGEEKRVIGGLDKAARKQERREMLEGRKGKQGRNKDEASEEASSL